MIAVDTCMKSCIHANQGIKDRLRICPCAKGKALDSNAESLNRAGVLSEYFLKPMPSFAKCQKSVLGCFRCVVGLEDPSWYSTVQEKYPEIEPIFLDGYERCLKRIVLMLGTMVVERSSNTRLKQVKLDSQVTFYNLLPLQAPYAFIAKSNLTKQQWAECLATFLPFFLYTSLFICQYQIQYGEPRRDLQVTTLQNSVSTAPSSQPMNLFFVQCITIKPIFSTKNPLSSTLRTFSAKKSQLIFLRSGITAA